MNSENFESGHPKHECEVANLSDKAFEYLAFSMLEAAKTHSPEHVKALKEILYTMSGAHAAEMPAEYFAENLLFLMFGSL